MRNMKSKVASGTLVVAAALIALRVGFPSSTLPRAYAQEQAQKNQRPTCSLETLDGRYGLTFTGFGTRAPVPAPVGSFIPVAGVGVVTFDGKGSLSLSETVSFGGNVAPLITSGTYTVNPDCTGSLNAINSASLNLVIVNDGKEILAINTLPGRVATDTLVKQ